MGGYNGVAWHPYLKKNVAWTLAPGLARLGRQLDKLGTTWYSIGNADHLDNVPPGGHTPWKKGAPFGTVTAIDVMKGNHPDVERRILKLMKMPGYDTEWIDFINTNGSQYDYDGRRQGPSGDTHLHLECIGSRTNFNSNLFYDMFGWPAGVAKPTVIPAVNSTVTTPTVTVTFGEDDMLKLVKLRSRDEVYLSEGGTLQHLSPAQFKAAQSFNLKQLPAGASAADKTKVQEAFVCADEAELALFGTQILPTTTEVEGL